MSKCLALAVDALLRCWHWPAPFLLLVACWVVLVRLIWAYGPLGDVALWTLGLPAALLSEGRAAGGRQQVLSLPLPLLPLSHRLRVLLTTLVGMPLLTGLWLVAGQFVPQPGAWWNGPHREPYAALWWLPGTIIAFVSARAAPHHLARLLPWAQLSVAWAVPAAAADWLASPLAFAWLLLGRGPVLAVRTAHRPSDNNAQTGMPAAVGSRTMPKRREGGAQPAGVLAQQWCFGLLAMAAAAVALQTAAQVLILLGEPTPRVDALQSAAALVVVVPLWLGRDSLGCFLPPLLQGVEPGLLLPVSQAVWWRAAASVTFCLAATVVLALWSPLHTTLAQGWFRGSLSLTAFVAPLGVAGVLAAGVQALRRGWHPVEVVAMWVAAGLGLAAWHAAAVPAGLGEPLASPLTAGAAVVVGLGITRMTVHWWLTRKRRR